MVELKALGGYERLNAKHPTVKVRIYTIFFIMIFIIILTSYLYLKVWGLISEEILNLEGSVPA